MKYDFGASRDLIFLDWYFLLNNKEIDIKEKGSYYLKGLNVLLEKNFLSENEVEDMKRNINLVLLVKFTLLSMYRKNGNKSLLHLSNFSLHECYFEAKKAFENLGINDVDRLISDYFKTKLALDGLVEKMYTEVSENNPFLKEIWSLAKDKMVLDEEVVKIVNNKRWDELVPFAIESQSSEILEYLVEKISDLAGYEYILRIASENKFINNKTKQLLLNSLLSEKFKNKLTI